ncbi:hypothetical protein [Streptomyces sp. NPDC051310]|uniref:hypothetical protein n=1 Tax=Streptomyces sp. NPDC051310 TaxID=3365649 RepID=UPI0037B24B67
MPNGTDDLFTVTEPLQMFADDVGVEHRTVEDWRYTANRWPKERRKAGVSFTVEYTAPTHPQRRPRTERHGFGRPPGNCRERRRTGGGFGDGYSAARGRAASASRSSRPAMGRSPGQTGCAWVNNSPVKYCWFNEKAYAGTSHPMAPIGKESHLSDAALKPIKPQRGGRGRVLPRPPARRTLVI